MNDDFLDGAIDQVARELTDGAPRPGLARRVQQRLEPPRALVGWRWLLAGGAIAAIASIVWFTFPGPTVDPILSPRRHAVDRVLPGPPVATGELRSAPVVHGPRHARRRPQQPPVEIRIPVDIEGAPQIAAIRDANALTVSPIEIPELNLAPLEPEKESR
jgi:hypothetical protein